MKKVCRWLFIKESKIDSGVVNFRKKRLNHVILKLLFNFFCTHIEGIEFIYKKTHQFFCL